jgi:hypothetical protein
MRLKVPKCGLGICCAFLASAAAILLLLPTSSATVQRTPELTLSIVGLKYDPGERVSKFDFKILGAQLVGLPRVPVGWTISISNDPSWLSEISGTAIVGAAFIQPEQFVTKFFTVRTMPDELKRFPGAPQVTEITGYVDLYKVDSTRRVTLTSNDFAMSPQ